MKKFTQNTSLICLLTLLLLGALPAQAQNYDFTWSRLITGPQTELPNDVAVDEAGAVIVVGNFTGNITIGAISLANAGEDDVFIAKFLPDGGQVWALRFGGGGTDIARSVTTDLENNIYVCGSFAGKCDFSATEQRTSAGQSDVYLAKFDPAGNLVWVQTAGGTGNDIANGCAFRQIDINGLIAVTGQFDSTMVFTAQDQISPVGETDVFVAAWDLNGAFNWTISGGGLGVDVGYGVAVDPLGDLYVVGQFEGDTDFGGENLSTAGDPDAFVLKMGVSGNVVWARQGGGVDFERAVDVACDPLNGIYVVGAFSSETSTFGTIDLTSPDGNPLGFLFKINSSGAINWAIQTESSGGPSFAYGVAVDFAADIYMTGNFIDDVTVGDAPQLISPGSGTTNIFVAKVSGFDGTNIWARQIGGTDTDGTDNVKIATDFDLNAYVVSDLRSATFGCTDVTAAPSVNDGFVVKMEPVRPPMLLTADKVNVTIAGGSNGSITATPANGYAPYDFKLGAGAFQASPTFSNLAAGTYQIIARGQDGCTDTISVKIVEDLRCDQPRDLSLVFTSSTSATISWTPLDNATEYRVLFRVAGAATFDSVSTPGLNQDGTYILEGLTPETQYEVEIKAVCASGVSVPSEIITLTTDPPCTDPVITLSNITFNSVTVTLDASAIDFAFVVAPYRPGQPTFDDTLLVLGTNTIDVTNLLPGTDYQIYARRYCGGTFVTDSSANVPFVAFTTLGCRVPTNIFVIPSYVTALVAWDAVAGAIGYEVEVKQSNQPNWGPPITVTGSDTTLRGLFLTVDYDVRVRTICDVATTSLYDSTSFTTLTCDAPEDLSVVPTGDGVRVTWLDTGADDYEVEYRLAGAAAWTGPQNAFPPADIPGLLPDSTYDIRVRIICVAGQEISDYDTVTVTIPSCVAPFDVTAEATPEGVRVYWSPIVNVLSYQLQFRQENLFFWSPRIPVNDTTYLFTGLFADTTYLFRVRAVCAITEFSTFDTAIYIPATCPTPTNVSLCSYGTNTGPFVAQWTSVPGADAYLVSILGSNGAWTASTVTDTVAVLGNEQTGGPIRIRVQAVCPNAVHSAYTDTLISTICPFDCTVPQGLSVSLFTLTTNTADATWLPVSGALAYEVHYRRVGAATWTSRITQDTTYHITGLTFNNRYEVEVRSICIASQLSDFSPRVLFRTLSGHCPEPQFFELTGLTPSTATVRWTRAVNAVQYEVSWRTLPSQTWLSALRPATDTTFTLSGLLQGLDYEITVRTKCGPGDYSAYKPPIQFTPADSCPQPFGVLVVNVTTNSAVILWSAVPGGLLYRVSYRKVGAGTFTVREIPAPPCTLVNLTPNTQYEFQIAAVCNLNNTSTSTMLGKFTTLNDACTKPGTLRYDELTSVGFLVEWDAVPGAVGYEVQYKRRDSVNFSAAQFTAIPSFNVGGLVPQTLYDVRVRTVCITDLVFSAYTSDTISTLGLECPVPQRIEVTILDATTVRIAWLGFGNIVRYNLDYKIDTSVVFTTHQPTDNVDTLRNLITGNTYQFRLRTECGTNDFSEFTAIDTFRLIAPCNLPIDLTITPRKTTATLKWTPPAGAVGYEIRYRRIGQANFTVMTLPIPSLSSFTINALLTDRSYEWQFRTLCAENQSDLSPLDTFRTLKADTCLPPVLLKATPNLSQAQIDWVVEPGAVGYVVAWKRVADLSWSTQTLFDGLSSSFTIDNLLQGEDYMATVQTLCSDVPSEFGDTLFFTTQGSGDCPVPAGLNVVPQATSAELMWDAVPGALGYVVAWRAFGAPSFNTEIIETPGVHNFFLLDLTSASVYEFQVQTICSAVTSEWSETRAFGTLSQNTCQPTSAIASNPSATSAVVSWAAVNGAVGYVVAWREVGAPSFSTRLVPAPALTTTLTALAADTDFEVQIQTLCSAAGSDFSAVHNFHTQADFSCAMPLNLRMASINTTTAAVKWDAVAGAIGYVVEWRPLGNIFASDVRVVDGGNNTRFDIDGLSPNTTYEVRVRALCADGDSPFTPFIKFTTGTGCEPPTNVFAVPLSHSAIIFWNEVAGANRYTVSWKRDVLGAAWVSVNLDAPRDSFLLLNLLSNTKYLFRVRARCGSQNTAWVNGQFLTPNTGRHDLAEQAPSLQASVYPNPTRGEVTLTFVTPAAGQIRVRLLDLAGRVLRDERFTTTGGTQETPYSLEGLPAGAYLLELETGALRQTAKLILQP